MPISRTTIIVPIEDVAFREIDREAVLLNLASGHYYGMNQAGTRAWMLLVDGLSLGAVVDRLVEEFDVPADVLERDLAAWLTMLLDKGLVREQ
jgi:hypothetical protein